MGRGRYKAEKRGQEGRDYREMGRRGAIMKIQQARYQRSRMESKQH